MTITVPRVSPQPIQVPYNQGAGSARPFGSGAAAAQYNLGGQIAQSGDVLGEYEARKQGLKRDDLHQNAIASLNDFYRKMQATGDFSDKAVADAKAHGDQVIADALSQYDGGDVTTQALRQNLEGARQSFDDQVAVGNLNYTDKQLNNRVGQKISGTVAAAQSDPSILNQNTTPYAFIQKHMGNFENQLDMLGMSQAQKQTIAPVAEQEVIRASVSQLIRAGQFDKARAYMDDPQLIEAMQPATRNEIGERILNAESEMNKGKLQAQAGLEEAATYLGLPTNDPRVHHAAALAKGLLQKPHIKAIQTSQGLIMFDENSGNVVNRLEGIKDPEQMAKASDADRLRSQYFQQAETFSGMRDQYSRLAEATKQLNENPTQDTGAYDLLLANTFQKIVDPRGVVREGDVGLQIDSQSITGQTKSWLEHVLNGGHFTPELRKAFLSQATAAYKAQADIQQNRRSQFLDIAKSQLPNFNPEQVVPDLTVGIKPIPDLTAGGKLDEGSEIAKQFKEQVGNIAKVGAGITKGLVGGTPTVQDHLKEAEQHIGTLKEHLPSVDDLSKMSTSKFETLWNNLQPSVDEIRRLRIEAPALWKALIDKMHESDKEKAGITGD